MKRTYTLSLLLLFALLSKGIAQQKVSGTITDDFKESVPGVNIIVKGTTKGTITDSEGNYELVVAKGDTLVASFIGFETQEIPINGQSVIDLTMGGVTELSEVVVLGYGSRARDELASAVSVVDHSEIEQFNSSTSIDNILQGKASGVSIVGANGRPGQTALVTVRGISTISGSIDPLYVVDGVPIDATNVNNINPADIESISVLKDAATSARYGSRAGAGVIVITTKSGETGEAQVTLRSSIGLSERIDDNFQLMNAGQSLQYESELAALGLNAAASQPGGRLEPAEWGPFLNRETDWEDELLMKGQISNMSLSVNGGTKENTYYFSIARDYNEGIIESLRGFERISSRLNASFQVNDWLKTGVNISVAHSISDLPRDRANIQNPFFNMYHYKPWTTQFLTDDNGEIIPDENGDPQYNFGEGITSGFNIAEALVNNTETITHLVSVASGYLEATPIKNVNYRLTVGISNDRYQRQRFTKPGSRLDQIVGDANNPGSKNDNGNNVYQVVATNVLGYSKVFNEVHNLSADLLYEFNRRRFTDYTLTSAGFVTDRISVQDISSLPTAVGSDASERILASYGAFTNYVYDDRYIASISLRRDGSSRFGEANRWGIFWSGSVAWNVHNESFFKFDALNSLKLRASYGINGNESIPDFVRIASVSFQRRNGSSTVIPLGEADEDIQWEQQQLVDVGLEATALDSRLRFATDYFHRVSDQLLGEQSISQTVGDENNVIDTNIGEIETSGIELDISADVVANRNVSVTLGGNIAFIDTKVRKLANNADIFRSFTLLREGMEINTFFLNRYAGVNPETGAPQWLTAEGELTEIYNGEDEVALEGKTPQPDYQGGAFVSVSWKGFDLRGDITFQGGNYIFNNVERALLTDGINVNRNQRLDALNYWRQPGDVNVLPNPALAADANNTSDRWLQKGDYIRLRNLSLGYNLPKAILERIGLDFVRVYVQGQNLLTYRPHFKGDPEVGVGSSESIARTSRSFVTGEFVFYGYPNTRSYRAGIEVRL